VLFQVSVAWQKWGVRVFVAFRKTLLSMYLAPFLLYLSSVSPRFLNHCISLPKPTVFQSFRAISAERHAGEQGNTQAFSVAVVASDCVGFHAAVVGVLALVSVAACCVQHPASIPLCVLAEASLGAWV
jgi:hypothetical protein